MKNFQNFQEFNIMQYFFIDQLGMFGYYVEIVAIFANMLISQYIGSFLSSFSKFPQLSFICIVNTGIVISNKNGFEKKSENISCFVSKTGDLQAQGSVLHQNVIFYAGEMPDAVKNLYYTQPKVTIHRSHGEQFSWNEN